MVSKGESLTTEIHQLCTVSKKALRTATFYQPAYLDSLGMSQA